MKLQKRVRQKGKAEGIIETGYDFGLSDNDILRGCRQAGRDATTGAAVPKYVQKENDIKYNPISNSKRRNSQGKKVENNPLYVYAM